MSRKPHATLSPLVGAFIIVGIIFVGVSGPLGLLLFGIGFAIQRIRTAGVRANYDRAYAKAIQKSDDEAAAAGRWICSS